MCGRYFLNDRNNPYINKLVEEARKLFNSKAFSSLALEEVYPSNNALVAIYDKEKDSTRFTILKWGLSLKNSLLINTRKEKLETPFYKDFRSCIIPASSYFEWSSSKQKYKFFIKNEPLFLAGLFKDNCFTIITEDAVSKQKEIHHREPVILNYEDAKKWCKTKDINIVNNKSILEREIERAD